jgi:hypothetical protein
LAKSTAAKAHRKAAQGKKGSTKLGQLQTMLRRPEGASIQQLVKALDWQAHSIRDAMSGSLGRVRIDRALVRTTARAKHWRELLESGEARRCPIIQIPQFPRAADLLEDTRIAQTPLPRLRRSSGPRACLPLVAAAHSAAMLSARRPIFGAL